ncbi:MAG: DUF1206 domain-containing protein [Bacteroidetes bacterium]|jgi:hypothetical protein|nr:DUF1206 domain-containing protein [Bacteroidota bacterium]
MLPIKSTAISTIARAGYIAKGMVYFMVGLLTFQTTIGMGGETSDATNALQEFIYQPFGTVLLFCIMIGLLAHAVWRILEAVIDPENRGGGGQIIFFRGIDFLVGCLYISMSYAAWQILQGLGAESGDQSTEVWVGKILVLPYGKWLVMVCAVVIFLGGIYQFYSAWSANFEESFDSENMSSNEKNTLRWLGRIGISAWGVVYCMVAYLFYNASVTFDADKAGGLSDALNTLREQPFGTWMLGITAGGLITYGIYLLVLSYYHKIFNT